MKPSASHGPLIGPVAPQEHAEALQLVFSRLAPEDRQRQVETLLRAVSSGEISPQGLLGARRGGRLVGAVFSQIQPGKTAAVWAPRIISGEPATTAGKLLAVVCDRFCRQDVRVAQIELHRGTQLDHATLRQQGFEPLAELLYMVSTEEEFPNSPPRGPLEYESYCPANHQRLARIAEDTYQQTLDCPQLDGVRQIDDVLAGYRATGEFGPSRWLIVRHRGRDVGCLLLADHPEIESWELVYMGVVAPARGHGWGMDITRHAQWLTRRAGRSRLLLAVDAANDPAIRTYAATGFRAWDRRSVYMRVFPPPGH